MIYTGYFAKQKLYESKGYECVSVARHTPKWFNGAILLVFAPTLDLLSKYKSGTISEMDYAYEYLTNLKLRENSGYLNWDKELAFLENKVMLCYERSDQFCHRHLISSVISNKGYKCKELLL